MNEQAIFQAMLQFVQYELYTKKTETQSQAIINARASVLQIIEESKALFVQTGV
jgi:hypothetical protein